MRPPPSSPGSISAPPRQPWRAGLKYAGISNQPDSDFSLLPLSILVNSSAQYTAAEVITAIGPDCLVMPERPAVDILRSGLLFRVRKTVRQKRTPSDRRSAGATDEDIFGAERVRLSILLRGTAAISEIR